MNQKVNSAGLPQAAAAVLNSPTFVGGFMSMWGQGDNPVFGVTEYLRTGVIKAFAGYENLLITNPNLVWNLCNQYQTPAAVMNVSAIRYCAGSGFYYFPVNGTGPQTSTFLNSGITATTVDVSSGTVDAFTFNSNYVIHITNTALTQYSLNSGVGTAIAATNTFYCGAVNVANTLGVMVGTLDGTSGSVCTSANAISWVQQVPAAITGNPTAYFAMWSPVSSTFIYCCSNGRIVTTANGFTLTDRGAPAGITSITQNTSSAASNCTAASPSVSLVAVTTNLGKGLLRTTDGINFTFTLWSVLAGVTNPTGGRPLIVWTGVNFIAFDNSTKLSETSWGFQSVDGLTWTRLPIPHLANVGITAIYDHVYYQNNQLFFIKQAWYAAPIIVSTSASGAATGVGFPLQKSDYSASNYAAIIQHIRIK